MKNKTKIMLMENNKTDLPVGYYIVYNNGGSINEDDEQKRMVVQLCSDGCKKWFSHSNYSSDMSVDEALKKFTFIARLHLDVPSVESMETFIRREKLELEFNIKTAFTIN